MHVLYEVDFRSPGYKFSRSGSESYDRRPKLSYLHRRYIPQSVPLNKNDTTDDEEHFNRTATYWSTMAEADKKQWLIAFIDHYSSDLQPMPDGRFKLFDHGVGKYHGIEALFASSGMPPLISSLGRQTHASLPTL
jgi:hypothetical protein